MEYQSLLGIGMGYSFFPGAVPSCLYNLRYGAQLPHIRVGNAHLRTTQKGLVRPAPRVGSLLEPPHPLHFLTALLVLVLVGRLGSVRATIVSRGG